MRALLMWGLVASLAGSIAGGSSIVDGNVQLKQDQAVVVVQARSAQSGDIDTADHDLVMGVGYVGGNAFSLLAEGEPNVLSVVQLGKYDGNALPFAIRNNTGEDVLRTGGPVVARDASGQLLAVGQVLQFSPNFLQAGEIGFGYAYFDMVQLTADAAFDLQLSATPVSEAQSENVRDLVVVEVTQLEGRFVGNFRNDHQETLAGPFSANIACFDKDGTLAGVGGSYPEKDQLAPDELLPFQIVGTCPAFLVTGTGFGPFFGAVPSGPGSGPAAEAAQKSSLGSATAESTVVATTVPSTPLPQEATPESRPEPALSSPTPDYLATVAALETQVAALQSSTIEPTVSPAPPTADSAVSGTPVPTAVVQPRAPTFTPSPATLPTNTPEAMVTPSTIPVAEDEQPSGSGGIGNTRTNVLGYWKIAASDDSSGEVVEDHLHYVSYDLAEYQLSFMFQLQLDDQIRPTDRAIDIVVSPLSALTQSAAARVVNGWLPADAEEEGPLEEDRFGELIQQYQSESMAATVPTLDHPRFEKPGTMWVTYFPVGSDVGVIEISLFYPRDT